MRALDWLKDPEKYPLKSTYVIHGDDIFLRREAADAIARLALQGQDEEVATTRFQGPQASLADVFDELRMLPFFTKRRVVVVDDADTFVTRHRKELETYAESPSRTGILILMVKSLPSNTKLAKVVESAGLVMDCKSPSEKELLPWVTHLAKAKHGVEFESDAARLLLELVGPEAGILATEVEKLVVFVGSTRKIRQADVAKLVEAGRIEDIWKVIDEATVGHSASAIEKLDDLLASGEYPARILAALSTSLLKLHHAGRFRAARLGVDEACRRAGIFGFKVEMTKRQHAHLGPDRVGRIPAMLLKADLDLKGGSQLEPRVVLEQLLVQLSLPRID